MRSFGFGGVFSLSTSGRQKKKARATSEGGDYSHQPCPWLNACDANMELYVFCQSTGCNERFMCIRTPGTLRKTRVERKLKECLIMLSLVGVQGGVTAGRSIRIMARDLATS